MKGRATIITKSELSTTFIKIKPLRTLKNVPKMNSSETRISNNLKNSKKILKEINTVYVKSNETWIEFTLDDIKWWDSKGNIEWVNKRDNWPAVGEDFKYHKSKFFEYEGKVVNEKFRSEIMDEYFRSLIEGKSVIYVGPSPILEGKGMGEFIDSFDVVVRSNKCHPVPDHLHKDYGSRCDILYTNVLFSKVLTEMIDKNPKVYDSLKLICSRRVSVKNFKKTRTVTCGYTKYSVNNKHHFTGSYTYLDILKNNPSFFYITGITFYLDGLHHHEDMRACSENPTTSTHDIPADINLFKNMVLPYVKVDDFLLNLLKLHGY